MRSWSRADIPTPGLTWTPEPPSVRTEVILLVVGLAVLVLAALPLGNQRVPGPERSAFRAVNDLPGFLYPPVWVVMQLGNSVAIPAFAVIALALRRYRLAIGLAVAGLAVYLLAILAKAIVTRGRPPALLAHVHIHGPLATGNGYPSGHAAVAFALATIAWLWCGPRLRWLLLGAAVVVCAARVYVGAHFPLDVVGGAALGVAGGALFGLALSLRHHGARRRAAGTGDPPAPIQPAAPGPAGDAVGVGPDAVPEQERPPSS